MQEAPTVTQLYEEFKIFQEKFAALDSDFITNGRNYVVPVKQINEVLKEFNARGR